jgi:hypothetical protein
MREQERAARIDAGSRRAIVIEALYGLVQVLEREDSEAAAEQAGGSDELGGLMTHGFANRHTEIGDLNSSNIERRLNEIKSGQLASWLSERRALQGLRPIPT